MKDPKIPLSEVKKLFKLFMTEKIHQSNFDQGQELNETMSVFENWWIEREIILKNKYSEKINEWTDYKSASVHVLEECKHSNTEEIQGGQIERCRKCGKTWGLYF